MRRTPGIISLVVLAASLFAPVAGAASSPEAAAWFERVSGIHEHGHEMEKLTKSEGSASFGGSASMDPMSQIGTLAEKFDFSVVEDKAGKVALEAELTAEGLKSFPQAQGVDDLGSVRIVIDKKTGVPVEMRMGDDDPYVLMNFSNPTFHEEGSLPEDLFVFVVPEGARVFDLGQMLSGTQGY